MLLEVKNLTTEFQTPEQTVRAVDGVSFAVDSARTLCIVGESGCGKSVTALSLLGLLPSPPAKIVAGSILLDGRETLGLPPEEMRKIRGGQISIIFQEPMTSLNPVLTVGRQISEAIYAHFPRTSRAEVRARVIELLTAVGIADPVRRYADYPHQMSGGMRQRIMIAMALSCRPKILIADEPTTALDVTIQAQILALINDLQAKMGMGVILVTHDLGVVSETADEVAVMYAGQIVERASVEELFLRPLHPYTKGLLQSIPHFNRVPAKRLAGIPGMVPPLADLPAGCRFQDRCAIVKPGCRAAVPELRLKNGATDDPGAGANHWVRCFEV